MAHDVFVSHSVKDKAVAEKIVARLEAESVRCWVAPRDVVPGADWGESIIDAIESSRIMVLIFSQNANGSTQIKREVERAVDKNVYTIPFRVEDIEPTRSLEYFISTSQWMDAFTPPLEQHLGKLAQTVKAILARSPVVAAETKKPSETIRRDETPAHARDSAPYSPGWLKPAIVVAALMLAAATTWYFLSQQEKPIAGVTPEGRPGSGNPNVITPAPTILTTPPLSRPVASPAASTSQPNIPEQPSTESPSGTPAPTPEALTTPKTIPAATPAKPAFDQNAQVIVFGYHQLVPTVRRPNTEITPEMFEAQMNQLKERNIPVIGMQDFLAWKRGQQNIPPRAAIITFDDGWKSQYEVGWPIMKKYGFPFTMFIYTEGVRGGRYGGGESMSWEQLVEMRNAGVDIQGHSATHQDLRKPYDKVEKKRLTPDEYQQWLTSEIVGSKQLLEQKLGIKVNCFAVPYGLINEQVREVIKKAGYEAVFTVYGQRLTYDAPNESLGRYLIEFNKPRVFTDAANFRGSLSSGSVSAAHSAIRAEEPSAVVQRYYDSINRRDLTQAYDCLSKGFKAHSPMNKFAQIFASTQSIEVRNLQENSRDDAKAVVTVSFVEVDAENRSREWERRVALVKEGDAWRIDGTQSTPQ